MRRFSVGALCWLVVTCASTLTRATEEDAKTFFAQGRRLRSAGNCADAIVAFRRAFEVFPQGLGSLRNIAECEEQLGQFASARNDWWSLRRAARESNEPKYDGWDKDAEQGYERLATKVSRVVVQIRGADPTKLQITVDGRPLDPRLVGVELERDIGLHIFQASYGGAAPVTERRTLKPGVRETVTLEIPVHRNEPGGPTAARGAPSPPPQPRSSPLRIAGIASMSVGGAGVVGAVISIVLRSAALSQLLDTCTQSKDNITCERTPELEATASRGKTATTLAYVFGGIAVAGIGAGVPLFIVGSRASSAQAKPATSAEVSLVPLASGGAARLEVRF